MPLTVSLADARAAFEASVTGLVGAVDGVSEWDLLGASRCHGWSRVDVLSHVLAGWQEMLGGFVDRVDDVATVDAATYWSGFAELSAGFDAVEDLLMQRRRSAAARPSALVAQLRDVADTMRVASRGIGPRRCRWQGFVFEPGDFLAVWAVEGAVHHLDLLLDAPPPDALALARATVEARGPVPAQWSDEEAVLIGSGRQPGPAGFPVLG